ILPVGLSGWGLTAPSVSWEARSAWSASPGVAPTTDGTATRPVPVYTATVTSDPRLACVPAFGLWSAIAPGCLVASTTVVVRGDSWNPALLTSFWAANTFAAPLRFGTLACLGSNEITSTARATATGATMASHQGSHGFWRNTATRGGCGAGGAAPIGVAVTWKRRSSGRPSHTWRGGRHVNGHAIALPGSIATLGWAKRNWQSSSVSSAPTATSMRALARLRMVSV